MAAGGIVVSLAAYSLERYHSRNAHASPPARLVVDRKQKDDRVEEMMERIHEGRKSPLGRTKAELAADVPDWIELAKHAVTFSSMSEALKKSPVMEIRDSAEGYADAVEALSAAVKQRDPIKARSALKALASSCTDCHYKGGPGGKLDDD
jgi:hypothetical protein